LLCRAQRFPRVNILNVTTVTRNPVDITIATTRYAKPLIFWRHVDVLQPGYRTLLTYKRAISGRRALFGVLSALVENVISVIMERADAARVAFALGNIH